MSALNADLRARERRLARRRRLALLAARRAERTAGPQSITAPAEVAR
ncbi:MAG: hypothetical protein ACTHOD_11550 [Motilibacteraceae bacterium]